MSRTYRNTPFHRQLGEAMNISATRRAKETRETLRAVRDFVFSDGGHNLSNEYEGDFHQCKQDSFV